MGTMSFDVPEGVTVQVLLGAQQPLALTDDSTRAKPPKRPGGKLVGRTVLVVALLGGGFLAGQHVRSSGSVTGVTEAAATVRVPPAVTRAFPEPPPPTAANVPSPAPASQQVPSAFTDQLQQTPAVQPPPGPPPSGGVGANGFGLEN